MKETTRLAVRRSGELSDAEIEEIRFGAWRLDCPRILLRGRGASRTRTYSGPGYVFQPKPGVLAYHLYSRRVQVAARSGWLDLARTGEILPEEAYFDFEAVDVKGRRWTSKRTLPSTFDRSASGKVIVDGQLKSLSTKTVLSRKLKVKGHSVDIKAFQKLDLPANAVTVQRTTTARGRRRSKQFSRNAWSFRTKGLDILIIQDADRMAMEVFSQAQRLPTEIHRHLLDSLEFVVGHSVFGEVVKVRRSHTIETTVFSKRGDSGGARWQPPLAEAWVSVPGTNRITSQHHKRLFERFLAHAMSKSGGVHSISGQLAAIREASAARYIDAYALTLAVAVESLLFSDVKVRVQRPTKDQVARLSEWIRGWRGSGQLKARALGAVASLGSIRAGDVLRSLKKKAVVTAEQYEAWQKLRNRSTHEYQLMRGDPDQLRKLIPHVQVMFYRLVFHAIGYRGPFTDYSAPEWPVKVYPEA